MPNTGVTPSQSPAIGAAAGADLATFRGALIDCDIHPTPPSTKELLPYFDDYWQHMMVVRGIDKVGLALTTAPPNAPINARPDWKLAAGTTAARFEAMRDKALDGFGARFAILNCIHASQQTHGEDIAAVFCRAVNDWLANEYLARDPRLRASMIVPIQNVELSVAEIERRAGDRRFVQVLLPGALDAPYGRRHFWPIYEAAERHGLAIGIHAGSAYRQAPNPAGWPSYFVGDYVSYSAIAEGQLLSLIAEGVFTKFPGLKVVFIECGFMWYPAFIWRADKSWRGLRAETPWLKQPPSEVVRQHVRFTLQPIDAPPTQEQLEQVLDHFGSDRLLMFSSDYPHWHYDGNEALPAGLSPELVRRILVDNPLETYPRLAREDDDERQHSGTQ